MSSDTKAMPEKQADIRVRTVDFACEVIRAAQFLHTRGPIARALSYQVLAAGTSIGANVQEADGLSSRQDFVAKMRIALKEAKETWFRLRVCRRCELIDERFDPLIGESEQIVRILATIVHRTIRNTRRTSDF